MQLEAPPRRWVKEGSGNDNSSAVAANLLGMLGVPVALEPLRMRVRTHPQYPKLPALVDSLEEAGLSVQPVSGEVDELADVALPAIAHFTAAEGGRFVVLAEVQPASIRYLDPAKGWVVCSPAEFGERWSGVLLLAELPANADFSAALAARRAERLEALRVPLLLGFGAIALAGLAALGAPRVPAEFRGLWAMLFVIKLAGLVASALLVALDPRHGVRMAQRLCPAGKVVDCASVLASPAAKLGGWVPMADLGVLYFFGGVLALATAGLIGDYATVLVLLAALTLPALAYSVFSVAYQAFVLRKACWLCLVVMGLFWVEAALLALAGPLSLPPLLADLPLAAWMAYAAGCFVPPGVAWGLLKPLAIRGVHAEQQSEELMRHRRNPLLLQQALQKQRPVDEGHIEPEIAFGAESAPLQLTLVVHPLCAVCREVHPQVERLVAASEGRVRCVIRLGYRRTDAGREIARRLIGIALSDGGAAAAQALHAWYADPAQGEARWFERFPLSRMPEPQRIDAIFEAHCAWVEAVGLDGVPAVFLDGQALPREFSVDDLAMLLRTNA